MPRLRRRPTAGSPPRPGPAPTWRATSVRRHLPAPRGGDLGPNADARREVRVAAPVVSCCGVSTTLVSPASVNIGRRWSAMALSMPASARQRRKAGVERPRAGGRLRRPRNLLMVVVKDEDQTARPRGGGHAAQRGGRIRQPLQYTCGRDDIEPPGGGLTSRCRRP